MKVIVEGQIFPKVWELANSIKQIRDERKIVNLGSGSVGYTVYEVELPETTKTEGVYLMTPQNVRLYHFQGDQYQAGYLISELDQDQLAAKHFKNSNK